MEESLDQISPILPIDFFQIQSAIYPAENVRDLSRKHLLPDFSNLLFEDPFAKVFMGWSKKGLVWKVDIDKEFEDCFLPDFRKGDSIEFFVDTRDLKTAGFVTRFCHHFVILPKVVEEVRAQEVTHFRTDDRHELCEGEKIKVDSEFKKQSYNLEIFIPSECLHGYDPQTFDRLGFSYRINRMKGEPQHFGASSDYWEIAAHPKRWSSLKL